MKAWFQSLAPRERTIVVAGGIVLLGVLLYLAAVEPMMHALAARSRRVASLEREIAWMRQAAAEVASLRVAGAHGGGNSDRPAYLAVDDVLRGSGLPQPDRLEPAGDGGARLEFKRVPFDPMMQVLARLRAEQGLQVTQASLDRVDPGIVSVRLTLKRSAS